MALTKTTPTPRPDFNQERYKRAQTAIDITHELASKDVVYDQWPIDDPYRDTALCVIESIHGIGNPELAEAVAALPSGKRSELVESIASVIELKVPTILSAYDNVHALDSFEGEYRTTELTLDVLANLHDGMVKRGLYEPADMAKGEDYVRETPPPPVIEDPLKKRHFVDRMSHYEQIQTIADTAHTIARSWVHKPGDALGVEERVMGAVHDTLAMFEHGRLNVPAFDLIPIDPETDEGCVTEVWRNGQRTEADWNYGGHMQLKADPEAAQAGADMGFPPYSLTHAFATHYETLRERYRASAQDLFGGGGTY
jgi:hypothetical protein